jgi:hypothetical protein
MLWRVAGLLGAVLFMAGCGPKLVRETVLQNDKVLVQLRHSEHRGQVVAHGRAQPATIADVRLAHILASLSHETPKGERVPTIRSEHVYELAEGMAKAFEKAGPDDEVIGVAYARDRRMGIFTSEKETSFRSWVDASGELMLEFFWIEEDLPDAVQRGPAKPWEPPADLPGDHPKFKLMPGQAQRTLGPRGVAVAWRDDYYRQPVAMRIRGGQVKRRTVLMEAPAEDVAPAVQQAPLPENLSDAQRRALDQLEAARREGLVRETEYQRRRILILEGKPEEAGYPPAAP